MDKLSEQGFLHNLTEAEAAKLAEWINQEKGGETVLELEHIFDLRWKADMRAIKRWQKATGRRLVWPDHADLVVWLLEREDGLRAATASVDAAHEACPIDGKLGEYHEVCPKCGATSSQNCGPQITAEGAVVKKVRELLA